MGCRAPDRRRHGRSGSRRVGRAAQRRRRGAAAGSPRLQGARLEDAHRGRARAALRPRRLVVRGVGRGPRQPAGVRRARHVGRPAAGRQTGHRGPRRRARQGAARRQVGLRRRRHPHRPGRRHLPVDRGGVDPGQGHPRPHHAGGGPALPGLRLRAEQGLPVPPAQDGAEGVGSHVDPPSQLGVHGPPSLVRHQGRGQAAPRFAD